MKKQEQKKLICVIFLILVSFNLFSCDSDVNFSISGNDETTYTSQFYESDAQYSYLEDTDTSREIIGLGRTSRLCIVGEHIYFLAPNSIYRLNPKTGNITHLCTDPICDHSTPSCSFYGIETVFGFCLVDNCIYYRQQYSYRYKSTDGTVVTQSANQISQYNLNTGEHRKMRDISSPAISTSMVFLDNWCYFTDMIFDDEKNSYTYSICRQDIDNLKIEVVDSSDSWRYDILLAYDKKIVMFDNLTNNMFSRDIYGVDTIICENIGTLFKKEDSFIYRDLQSGQVKKCDLDGGQQSVLIDEDVTYFYVTNEYIYYTLNDNREIGINERDQSFNVNVSSIMRVDCNGENKKTIYTPSFNDDFFILFSDFIVEGRYIYTTYDWYEKNDDGKWVGDSSKSYGNYLRYDTETEEIYYFNFD